jgi:uncharacterized protein (TIGR02246 family)
MSGAQRLLLALAFGAVCCVGCAGSPDLSNELSEIDRAAVERATQAYADAWLSNDSTRVMATLTPDAVLLPSGMEAISGDVEIRRFWWPADSPPTRVTAMEQSIDDVVGAGDLAVVRGHGTLSFVMKADGEDVTRTQRSTFMNVLRRHADGSWRIAQRMWIDIP